MFMFLKPAHVCGNVYLPQNSNIGNETCICLPLQEIKVCDFN